MRWTRCATVLFGLGLAPAALCGEAQEVVDAVEAKYAQVEAIKARFVQTTHSEIFGSEEQGGSLVLKRPAKMRWEFTTGVEKQFITDGSTMWVFTRSENQAIRYDDVSSTGAADSLLQSLDKLDEMFEIQLLPPQGGGHHLQLVPKGDEQRFKKLELVLDAELVVQHLEFTDAFDAVTEIEFSQVQLNAEAPDSLFQFQVPEGVEVISAGGM